jgi:putrescine aminotransferase
VSATPAEITQRYASHVNPAFVKLLGTFGYGRVFVGASGLELWDAEGRRYLDFLAGFGSNILGHNPEMVLDRLRAALDDRLCHVIHVGPQRHAADLAAALAERLPSLPMCMLSLSGGEAVESAMKLARAATGRATIVYAKGGFHGTGLGDLSINGHSRWRKPFEPLLPECVEVPFGSIAAIDRALAKHRVAAVLVEPIQAEAGVVIPPDGYLASVQRRCRERGALFALDEVQTGLARTGTMFAFEHWGLDPDVVVLGKGLGAGVLPVATAHTRRELFERAYGTSKRFDLHGSTYSGHALGCITALATLEAIRDEKLCARAVARGEELMTALRARLGNHPLVREVRGKGLLVAIELGSSPTGVLGKLTAPIVDTACREVLGQWLALRLLESGFVCQPASQRWNVLKLTPPLTVTSEAIQRLVATIGEVLDEYKALGPLTVDVARRLGNQWRNGGAFG